jgi:hypothetical protein
MTREAHPRLTAELLALRSQRGIEGLEDVMDYLLGRNGSPTTALDYGTGATKGTNMAMARRVWISP